MIEEKYKSDVMFKMKRIVKSRFFAACKDYAPLISIVITGIGVVFTFLLNFYMYIYWCTYAYYWEIDVSDMPINQPNTFYSLIIFIVFVIVFIFPFFCLAKLIYEHKTVKILSIIVATAVMLPAVLYFALSFTSMQTIVNSNWFMRFYAHYLTQILFIFFIFMYMLLIGFMTYCETNAYKKIHDKKVKKNKRGKYCIRKAPKKSTYFLLFTFLMSLMILCSAFIGYKDASMKKYLSIYQVNSNEKYVVVSNKDNSLYLEKCEFSDYKQIIVFPNNQTVLSQKDKTIKSYTFNKVLRKYEILANKN